MGAKMALQLAERGYFAKELNVGWAEWQAEGLPMHSARVVKGEVACSCSKI